MKTDKEEKQTSQQNDEEQKPRRTMLSFDRDGFVIPVWGIMSIEKDVDYNVNTNRTEYLIVLNKGMEVGMPQCPIGERRVVYYDSETRNKAYVRMLAILEASGVEFIQLN